MALSTQLLAALGLAASALPVLATVYVSDCGDGTASGTLRNTIATAPEDSVVDVSACVNSTITLGGEIVVAQNTLAIYGPNGGALTISGNHAGRVFRHTGSGTLKLQDVTVADGTVTGTGDNQELYGGCIQSGAAVWLLRATVSGCSVTGPYDGDNAQGGGIFTLGTVTADYSTISGNSATSTSTVRGYAYAGGIDALSGLYAHHSTISNNTAAIAASGLDVGTGGGAVARTQLQLDATTVTSNSAGKGGGVYFIGGSSDISNTTIAGNVAAREGGGLLAHATLNITGSTLDGNSAGTIGGAIYAPTTVNLTNSTVSGNRALTAGGGVWANNITCYFCTVYANRYTQAGGKGAGLYFTSSANLTATIATSNGSDDTDAPSNIPLTGTNNIIGASGVATPADTLNCDPKFGPLANFGGSTRTLPLLSGSCAIDMGPFSPLLASDQRGATRPVQLVWAVPRSDIGAFEKQTVDDPDYIFINGFGAAGSD